MENPDFLKHLVAMYDVSTPSGVLYATLSKELVVLWILMA